MKIRQATCSCTQLNAVTEGEPVRVSICHCRECQRRTGNVFGVQARFPRERVKVAGRFNRHARTGDSGERILFHFCPHCGSTVYYWAETPPRRHRAHGLTFSREQRARNWHTHNWHSQTDTLAGTALS
ncbi:MAG: GFA family protein [Polyangiaceae bacterium]